MDAKESLLRGFGEKREHFHLEAQRQREVRDRLNDQTKAHAARRDELNARVRGIVEQANAHRAKRDELNVKVREAKAQRDELNRVAQAKAEALHALRKTHPGHQEGAPPAKLKAEIRHLEYLQQTTALAPKKEKELIELIAAKTKELKTREGHAQETPDTQKAYDEMRAAKAAAEEQHAALTLLANQAQAEHEAMAKLFSEADGLRKQADQAQADFVKSKVEADKVHRAYIVDISAMRDLDKVIHAMRPREAAERGPMGGPAAQAEADEIFDKFRKGEKLSTEDLMALQKAGRL